MLMPSKKFSLESAYSWGFKTVLTYFSFFLTATVIGSIACAVFLSLVGVLDFWAFREHFGSLSHFFEKVVGSATGPLHHSVHTVPEHMRAHLPNALSRFVADKHVLSLDVSGQDLGYFVSMVGLSSLGLKLVVDTIAVGWTKMALDLQDKKAVSEKYLYKFYALVPRYFAVNLIAGLAVLATLGAFAAFAAGMIKGGHPGVGVVVGILSMIPGIIVHQRLRFAKYLVLDKNKQVIDALQGSWKMTDGLVAHLVVYSVLATLVAGLGCAVFLSIFITVPLAYQVDAHIYRQISK